MLQNIVEGAVNTGEKERAVPGLVMDWKKIGYWFRCKAFLCQLNAPERPVL